jgi:radical SAM/Cys-rich protein
VSRQLSSVANGNSFSSLLRQHALPELHATEVTTLQVNVGKYCNQTCRHCHVDAGPHRVAEQMNAETADLVLDILLKHPTIRTLDITGGAPELNANFRRLVSRARELNREVIDRCNLTVLFVPGQEGLAEFLALNRVHIIASLPCYLEQNVDRQRGGGVFQQSIRALRLLNELGYGRPNGPEIDLVFNTQGAGLPPPQAALEADYKRELHTRYGITFNRLLTITNMPIARFKNDLQQSARLDGYMDLLAHSFNPRACESVMCRSLISVGWDGRLYDCDFNQMLDLPLLNPSLGHLRDFDLHLLAKRRISSADHCLGCTAGAGSSCGGALKS